MTLSGPKGEAETVFLLFPWGVEMIGKVDRMLILEIDENGGSSQ